MLRLGTPTWILWLFGIITTAAGFILWHRQGEHFGFGAANGHVDRKAAIAVAGTTMVIIIAELLGAVAL